MDKVALARRLAEFPTGNLCDAHPRVRAMDSSIAPLYRGARLAGPAKTARIAPGQNAAIHRAVHSAEPGQVLVVDGGRSRSFGPFGDLLAACCQNRGIAGLVIDASVRDSEEIADMGFPVFCLGANPTSTAKTEPGEVDIEITCGGMAVRPGDLIVADADGVVVIPREIAAEAAERADAVAAREERIRAGLAGGKTTFEILGLGDGAAGASSTESQNESGKRILQY